MFNNMLRIVFLGTPGQLITSDDLNLPVYNTFFELGCSQYSKFKQTTNTTLNIKYNPKICRVCSNTKIMKNSTSQPLVTHNLK